MSIADLPATSLTALVAFALRVRHGIVGAVAGTKDFGTMILFSAPNIEKIMRVQMSAIVIQHSSTGLGGISVTYVLDDIIVTRVGITLARGNGMSLSWRASWYT